MDLTYLTSKIFWFVARPDNLVLIVLLIGTCVAWMRSAEAGRTWLTSVTFLLVLFMILPVSSWVARALEQRFLAPNSLPTEIDGILVLGGSESFYCRATRPNLCQREC
jgi:uncharacterized SAM-binding protein YcdF (DUF218 family)